MMGIVYNMEWNGLERNRLEWNRIDWSVANFYFEIYFRNNSSPPERHNI